MPSRLWHALLRSDESPAWSVRSQRRFGIGECFGATAAAEGADEDGGLGALGVRIDIHPSSFLLETSSELRSRRVGVGEQGRHGAAYGKFKRPFRMSLARTRRPCKRRSGIGLEVREWDFGCVGP